MSQNTAYIALGSNLGNRKDNINRAMDVLENAGGVKVVRKSAVIASAALSNHNQPEYLNAVAELETQLTADGLLEILIRTQEKLGRKKADWRQKWSPRTIDLDLLFFENQIINKPHITVPHPRMHLRSFVLEPLCQLNPSLRHPVLKETMATLAERLNGADFDPNAKQTQLVSIAGLIGVGKTTLAERLSGRLKCRLMREAYKENPFMPQVYAGRKELALDSQLFFLTARLLQLDKTRLEPQRLAITDYIFEKELIYAKQLLDSRQLAIYEKIYHPLRERISPPVVVVYLTDSVENCLSRIHFRKRPYEQSIRSDFLAELNCAYEELFRDWRICPVIRLSMSHFDCRGDNELRELIIQIKSYLPAAAARPGKTLCKSQKQ